MLGINTFSIFSDLMIFFPSFSSFYLCIEIIFVHFFFVVRPKIIISFGFCWRKMKKVDENEEGFLMCAGCFETVCGHVCTTGVFFGFCDLDFFMVRQLVRLHRFDKQQICIMYIRIRINRVPCSLSEYSRFLMGR